MNPDDKVPPVFYALAKKADAIDKKHDGRGNYLSDYKAALDAYRVALVAHGIRTEESANLLTYVCLANHTSILAYKAHNIGA